MMVLYASSVDDWHRHVTAVVAEGAFTDVRIQPPEALGDARVLHVVDPAGVLLVFVQLAAAGR
ncbi:MAG: hypothetical protein H0V44_18240 [Planctomycetes bacterium]|nr:hypothetical protein [Planctomycetota bacterium]